MWTTFKATVLAIVRTPRIMVWTALFPIVLSTIFSFMFQSFSNDGTVDAVPVAVVADAAWRDSGFSEQVDALAEGDEPLLDVREVADAATARKLLKAREVEGVLEVEGGDVAGDAGSGAADAAAAKPKLTVLPDAAASDALSHTVDVSILESVASGYVQAGALIGEVAKTDPAALADAGALKAAFAARAEAREVSLTRDVPDQTVRYYYALLGMAALFGAMISTWAVVQARPSVTAVGARRAIAPVRPATQLVGLMLGSWATSFGCLLVAFAYVHVVAGVSFAGREGLCLLGLAIASLLATAIGALVGALPLRGEGARSGVNTTISCVGSLFAGLYGQPSMQLADEVARAVPAEAWLNPARLISDLFYALYYYDSLVPFALRLAACAGFSLALIAVAGILVGRGNHGNL